MSYKKSSILRNQKLRNQKRGFQFLLFIPTDRQKE